MIEDAKRAPVRSLDEISEYFCRLNPEQRLLVGIEWERSGVFRDTLDPVNFLGEKSYSAIYRKLIDEAGWEVLKEEKGNVYELKRGEAKVTTEADGRPELSGSAQENLHNLARELRLHNNEIVEMGNVFNVGWIPLCWQPLHPDSAIPFVPKDRYKIFANWGIESTIKRNNGLTANLSFTTEENMVRKAQTMFRITPVVAAMFASGPFDEGGLTKCHDMRRKDLHSHPERFGSPNNILTKSFSLEEWISWYMGLPITFIIVDGKETQPERKMTFREWMEGGHRGRFPTAEDFDQHVKTTWSDLRMRQGYIESRIAGSVPFRLAMSLPALMKGLVFDSESWDAVEELMKKWTYDDVIDADRRALTEGLQTEVHGHTLLNYGQELITIANEKLHMFERKDAQEEDESIYLAPLKEQIFIKEKSPAEELVELYEGEWNGDLSRIIEWCEAE